MKLLVLGGTTEASALARALAGDRRFTATLSLAGRTANPVPQPLDCRIGGFGGVEGLAHYLSEHGIDALIDATHPFAAQMTRHAALAAQFTGTKLLVVLRPEWRAEAGDRWVAVDGMVEAAGALGSTPRRVLLTVGRKDLAPFAAAPWHRYVIRSVDAPPGDALPPHAEIITARGPFTEADERQLLVERGIEVLVTKNSGGSATRAKLAAARRLGLQVIMVARPAPPAGVELVATAAEAMAWLELQHAATLLGA